MKRTLTKDIDDYAVETRTAAAARQLRGVGVKTHAGERVSYLITSAQSKDKTRRVSAEELISDIGYDVRAYIELLRAAADEVLKFAPCPSQ
jgi:DNA polymerase elongation subunit (family B)